MFPLLWLLLPLLAWGGEEFSFDAASFEKKRFDTQGYLRSENATQWMNSPFHRVDSTSDELNLQAFWDEAPINLYADGSLFYRDNNRRGDEHDAVLNSLLQRFGDERENIETGKKVLRWGKGYAYSPLAFFEPTKDPLYPDLSREGFWMVKAQVTRTSADLPVSAYTLDLLYLPDSGVNREHFARTDSHGGAKLYLLVGKSDIDIVIGDNLFGADISADIGSGFEVHSEWGRKGGAKSYLAGVRYQSPSDLTLIAEYFRTYESSRYRYLKLTQKEPFGWVYSSFYTLYLIETEEKNYRFLAGGTYDFKNGFTIDLAYMRSDLFDGIKAIVYFYF